MTTKDGKKGRRKYTGRGFYKSPWEPVTGKIVDRTGKPAPVAKYDAWGEALKDMKDAGKYPGGES